jgi:hypothetical protein
MKIAFLTEMGFQGKIPSFHPNMRTEFAWMHALDANHYNVYNYASVNGYDYVFIIFPKGMVYLNAVGAQLVNNENPDSKLFSSDITSVLKNNNKKVCFVQEGPCWLFNDYSIVDQFNYYNQIQNCDILFVHNVHDSRWYQGLFPNKIVKVLPTLIIEDLVKDIPWNPQDKVIVGGNFARWYGGFQSYMVSDIFHCEKWCQESHAKRENEDQIPDLQHLPRLMWLDWIKSLSTFKYAVHMMPTVAAGTFSLNCAYFGIPCIGNNEVDTQFELFPQCSVDSEDVLEATNLAKRLYSDKSYYKQVSDEARELSRVSRFVNKDKWLKYMMETLT